MIKQQTVLEVKVNERIYQLFLASDTPLGEAHDAIMQMKGYIVDRMVAAQKEQEDEVKRQQAEDGCC